ncbi:MAG: OmpA family protein, partial [Prolixibacteraceae bacterium]|nr:OmpA family protein [Prolixibacteraceae bacterium]
ITLNAQIKVNVRKKIKQKTNQRANNRTDQAIDKGLDKLEEGIGSLFKKKKKGNKNQSEKTQHNNTAGQQTQAQQQPEETSQLTNTPPAKLDIKWAKYDFVPGDEVIFEDAHSVDEENGEFPSRWDLYKGNVEIGEVNGENVIMFISRQSYIIPYLKNFNEDYLPDIFTLELDVWFAKGNTTANRLWIYLCDKKNNNQSTEKLCVMPHSLEFMDSEKSYPGTEKLGWSSETVGSWKHISMAYTKGKFKAYFNDTRLINVPHLEINPSGITIEAGNDNMFIKNIRIAKGGVKYYDRVLSDGKIIVNGIRFDVNKATIKPESNGAINKIFELMQKQPDLNFSVEGHTDSDGNEAANMKLSKARGKAVMERLISMGIAPNRLKYDGFGESKPIDTNATPEGKANNRRVEFVKFSESISSLNSASGNSVFDNINAKTISSKLETLPSDRIQVSVPTGVLLNVGTIVLYKTSDGNPGKMEFLKIDKNDNYKLIARYVTYNPDGSVLSQSNHIEVKGTYNCDLDVGNTENIASGDEDFQWGRTSKTNTVMWQSEKSQLRVYTN